MIDGGSMFVFFQNRHPHKNRTILWIFAGCILFLLFTAGPVRPVDVDDLEIIPKKVLDKDGIGADIALNPVDGSVHVVWIKDGNIKYAVRQATGAWGPTQVVPDAGLEVFGTDERDSLGTERPRKALGLTVDNQGITHLVFGTRGEGIHYMQGTPDNWGYPERISGKPSIYNDIVIADGKRVTVWEDGEADQIYTMIYKNGRWEDKISMGRGEYPSLYTADNVIYFVTRNRKFTRNATFAYMNPGSTRWNFNYDITEAENRLGEGPHLAIGQDKLYMAWSNSEAVDIIKKSQLYCAVADKPGNQWRSKMGGSDPLWYEDTAAPHPRVALFNDGTLLYFNGRRRHRQFIVFNEGGWSNPREAPWKSGIAQVACDGTTAWIVVSPFDYFKEREISVTGIKAPEPDHIDDLVISDKTILDATGYSGELALHPLDRTLHCAWVSNGDIKYKVRQPSGDWSSAQTLPDAGHPVRGLDELNFARKCISFDIDHDGTVHLVFAVENGDIYYVYGTPGSWSVPTVIATGTPKSIYPDLLARRDGLFCTFEAAATGDIYMLEKSGENWSKKKIGSGGWPSMANGRNGMIYLLYQNDSGPKNAHFLHKVPGFTDWQKTSNILDPADMAGWGPGMAVGDDKIYLAWNNDTDEEGDWKSQLYCAVADEPGNTWTARLGTAAPLYYENTGDPFPRACVFSDSRVLYMNGKRRAPRIMFWNGVEWSKARNTAWGEGAPDVKTDGRTAWVLSSSSYHAGREVSVTAIENPAALQYDLYDQWPVITSTPPQTAQTGQNYVYQCTASDPGPDNITFSLIQSPQGMDIGPLSGTIQWRPDEAALVADPWGRGGGVHLVGIKVKDDHGGFKTQYFWLQVTEGEPNRPPQITSSPDTQIQEGSAYTYLVTATDADFDPLTFSLTESPADMTIGAASGLINWAATAGHAGLHPVTVQVSDGRGGTDSQSYTLEVTEIVIPPPVADFTANPTSGVVPLTVQFSDRSTGEINSYTWDFGDGATSHSPNPSHRYQTPGVFTVSLMVTGPGGSNQNIKQDYIQVNNMPPVADFNAAPLDGTRPLTVQFSSLATGTITAYAWDFGDQGTSTAPNPQHTFNQAGEFTIRLQVTGPGGTDTETKEKYIRVRERPPVAQFGAEPQSGDLPLTVQFSDSSSGVIDSRLWNFGDGQTSALQNPVHTYDIPGKFDVYLQVTGPGGTDTEVKEDYITVQGIAPIAAFRAEPREGYAPLQVQFTNLSSGNYTSQVWNFGDGATSDTANPVHTFTAPGLYEVSLIVAGPSGSDMETKTGYIRVIDPKPVADFGAGPTSGLAPLTVQFSDSSSGQIDTRLWDFGDGGTSTSTHPEHTYTVPGIYTVSLFVSGSHGYDTETKTNYINISGEKPAANFRALPLTGTVPLQVMFYDESTGTITTRLWNFGDGTTSAETDPKHVFQQAGRYTVSLTVAGPGGSDTKTISDYITVTEPAPVADFSAAPLQGNVPLIVQFSDSSQGLIHNRTWDFGDGSTSSSTNPTHLFLTPGEYTIKLTVSGPGGSDTRTRENLIRVLPPVPRAYFGATPREGETPLTVMFSDSSSGEINYWRWDFGDSTTGEGPNPYHIYENPGRYTVKLTVEGPGGSNTIERPNFIYCRTMSGVVSTGGTPQSFSLFPNYPNPFNGSTTIVYQVAQSVPVFLGVFDIRGHLVAVLQQGRQSPGTYKTSWNGVDDAGRPVASGIYMVQFIAGGFRTNEKSIYLK